MTLTGSAGLATRVKRVAVMQPYFFPYGGYFRLFASADQVVLFDCVQFPRRGRVHRAQVPGPQGATEWLTLPLARQPRDVLIKDLRFADGARGELDRRLARLTWLRSARGPVAERVREHLHGPLGAVIDYLEDGLRLVTDILALPARLTRSSAFATAPGLHSQDRVIAIARACGASTYVNPPGGRRLYDAGQFARHDLALEFLPNYSGRFFHMLHALVTEEVAAIREDILAQCVDNVERN